MARTAFDEAGGMPGLLAMTTRFFASAREDDILGPVFAHAAPEHAEHLAGWLAVVFGGPRDYLAERGDLRFVIRAHKAMKVTEDQRARWVSLMLASGRHAGLSPAFLQAMARFSEGISHSVRENSWVDPAVLEAALA